MDILDIDSLLNDDSFCLTEEKIYDDVTNIIKQWKINNGQNIVFDSRTFTRPKQKITTNLEPQFKNYMNNNEKLQMGGLVTQKQPHYLLGNISPPNSKYCSLDITTNQMFNSLITSADFSNITFLSEEHLPTATLNSKQSLSENLKKPTIIEDDIEEIDYNPDFEVVVPENFEDPLEKGNTLEQFVENEKKSKLDDHCLNATFEISDDPINTMLLNETFDVEQFTNSPECNRICNKFSNTQIENLNTANIESPYNKEQRNIFKQSTPQIESETSFAIHLSPIRSEIKNNINHSYENLKSRKTSLVKNTCEKNFQKLLDSSETNNMQFSQLDKKNNSTNLFQDRNKSSQMANINQSLDTIKKRFTNKAERAIQNNITFTENSEFSPRTERLLNKRGTIYDNMLLHNPENIPSTENQCNEENNLDVVKLDKNVEIEQKMYPIINNLKQSGNNRDQYNTVPNINKTNSEQLNKSNNSSLESVHNSRFTLKNRNSPNNITNKTDNAAGNKILKGHLSSTYICKTNSASELGHSVCPKECTTQNNQDLKNNMGLKAKSFNNLSSNNFGYSKNLVPAPYTNRVSSSDDKLCEVLEVRPATTRRTGMIRPSTGIYSKGMTKHKDVAVYKYECEENAVNLTHTAETNRQHSAERNVSTKGTIRYQNVMNRKSKLLDTRVRSNIKDSGLLRHSNIPKKE